MGIFIGKEKHRLILIQRCFVPQATVLPLRFGGKITDHIAFILIPWP